MTRAEVADAMDVSVSTVRRMEGRLLHPIIGGDGARHFDPAEVLRVIAERAKQSSSELNEGERDARVFDLLAEGKGLRDIVIALRLPVEVVARLVSLWGPAERGDVVIPPACRVKLVQCLGPFADAAALTELVRSLESERERLEREREQERSRVSDLIVAIGTLAASDAGVADALPALKEQLDVEQRETLDRVVAYARQASCGTGDHDQTGER
jgi:hypothetical protein